MIPSLLDTGPVVALLDRKDPYHDWVVPRFHRLQGRLVTTGAVVTEATFFLQNVRDGISRLFELLANPRVEVRDSFQPRQPRSAAAFMERYASTPMDFADATLVVLAEELEADRVLTLDERGFRTYRHRRSKPSCWFSRKRKHDRSAGSAGTIQTPRATPFPRPTAAGNCPRNTRKVRQKFEGKNFRVISYISRALLPPSALICVIRG
jgi:predicted nucleic acid-binding protein